MPKVLPPIRYNIGIEVAYRRKLTALIKQMNDAVRKAVLDTYSENEPKIAMDATPSEQLRLILKKISKRWIKEFDELSDKMAKHFATDVAKRSDASLRNALRKHGMAIEFKPTAAMKDVMGATVQQNVSLIKSIPEQYLKGVEGMVMRSVQVGGDLQKLSEDLQKTYGVSKRRAALIARDQNIKATSAMNRARQLEIGVEEAIWVHSHAGKEPRPTHVKNNGKRYDVKKGWYDPAVKDHIFPGQLINCRCTSRSVIPGL